MKSVTENVYSFFIKNSKFIGLVFPIQNNKDTVFYINYVKNTYKDATHYCYAYILDNIRYASDDGEPSGTAGIPILLVLEKQNLNHVLCIVVRYFGKIKLGASGLVRAYTKATTEVLKNHVIVLEKGYLVKLVCTYQDLKMIDFFLKDKKIVHKDFQEKITYEVEISEKDFPRLKGLNYEALEVIREIYLSSK